MRILIVCPCPLDPQLGAAQGHLNLAAALRKRDHEVDVWPVPALPPGTHWMRAAWSSRATLRSFVRHGEPYDVVDCPPAFIERRFGDTHTRWLARSTQPDILYLWQTVRADLGLSRGALERTVLDAGWWAFCSLLVCRGMSAASVVACHGNAEKEWIGRVFPWLRAKVHTYEAALSDDDRRALAEVRHARSSREAQLPTRYLWLGRWVEHKGVSTLTAFLRARLAQPTNDETFTVAGCGPEGERALAPLASSGRLRVVPSYARSELPALLAAHDAGLFTSRAEGWGLVLNEMVESGLPVYATRAGGVDELRSVLGSFIPAFPPPPGAVLPRLPDEEAFARYGERFCWDAVAQRYLEALTPTR